MRIMPVRNVRAKQLLLLFLLCLGSFATWTSQWAPPGFGGASAADSPDTSTPPATNPETTSPATRSGSTAIPPTAEQTGSTGASSAVTIQGGVEKIQVSLSKLRDVGLDLKHLLKAVSGLYDEVTITPVDMITEPEVVGRGVIINIPIGTRPIGPAEPPHKDRVDLSMSQIRPVVTMMKSNVDEFVSGKRELDLSPELEKQLQPQIQDWTSTVDQLAAQLAQLNQLTLGPKYDNDAIATLTTAMEKNIKELDDDRRTIYKVVRDDGKARKKRHF